MLSTKEVIATYLETAKRKVSLSVANMFILGIMAGILIAFAGVTSSFSTAAGNRYISAAVFPFGLIMVLSAKTELFTGNCLMPIALVSKKITLAKMLKSWFFVYIGNFVGSILIAWMAAHSGCLNNIADSVMTVSLNKIGMTFGQAFLKAVMCNFLVCLAVWMNMAAKNPTAQMIGAYVPIFVFVACGFEHSIANMFFIPVGMFLGSGVSWTQFLINNLFPVTLGNIAGGSILGLIFLKTSKN